MKEITYKQNFELVINKINNFIKSGDYIFINNLYYQSSKDEMKKVIDNINNISKINEYIDDDYDCKHIDYLFWLNNDICLCISLIEQ